MKCYQIIVGETRPEKVRIKKMDKLGQFCVEGGLKINI